jgi:ribose-phosphate pyrophosphokinase
MLGLPLLHGWKTRDVSTGTISGFGLEPCEPRGSARVLVVDDICDGGGTFMGLGKVINDRLIKADLYVTHGIFSQGTLALAARYGTIICTDSIVAQREGVRVIPVCNNYMGGDLT